jgi:hypothetical protein
MVKVDEPDDETSHDALTADSLLNQQILPVLSQQLLTHMAAKQKPHSLTLGWDEEEGLCWRLINWFI